MIPVFFNRFDADTECIGYLLIGTSFGNELEHLAFSWAQGVFTAFGQSQTVKRLEVTFLQALGDFRAKIGFPAVHLADRFRKKVRGGLLNQIPRRTEFDDTVNIHIVIMGRAEGRLWKKRPSAF